MTLRWTTLIFCVLGMVACAKLPSQQLDAARYMVARAKTLQAQEYAPYEYRMASDALQDAEQMIGEQDYDDAASSLEFALQHARRAISLTETAKQQAEEEVRREAERVRQADEQAAKFEQSGPGANAFGKQKPALKSSASLPTVTYEVGGGETLWTISQQPVVYGDSLLWPLLYQANRDQIKDPRQIYPGQVLNIRRDVTPQEMEDARQKARESNIFPVTKP